MNFGGNFIKPHAEREWERGHLDEIPIMLIERCRSILYWHVRKENSPKKLLQFVFEAVRSYSRLTSDDNKH